MEEIHLQYFGYHPYNNPTLSERNVELPLAFWFLERFGGELGQVIEIGEVTPFYHSPRHNVIDPFPQLPTTVNANAANAPLTGKHVLSISTIEHIGLPEYEQTSDPSLLPRALENILKAQTYLVTFALGYNRALEALVRDLPHFVLERTAETKWRQISNADFSRYNYNAPYYAGNAVCVLTNLSGLQLVFSTRGVLSVLSRWNTPRWGWRTAIRAILQERRDR